MEKILLVGNKHGNYSSLSNQIMPKMHQIRLAAGPHPDPLGELIRSSRPTSRNGGGLLLR